MCVVSLRSDAEVGREKSVDKEKRQAGMNGNCNRLTAIGSIHER
jgi:hypothetical protein